MAINYTEYVIQKNVRKEIGKVLNVVKISEH